MKNIACDDCYQKSPRKFYFYDYLYFLLELYRVIFVLIMGRFLLLTWCGITKRYHRERKKIHFDLYLFWLDNYRYTYFNQEGFKFSDINILITRLGFSITIYLWTYTHNFKLIFSVIIVRLIDFHNSYFHQWFDY